MNPNPTVHDEEDDFDDLDDIVDQFDIASPANPKAPEPSAPTPAPGNSSAASTSATSSATQPAPASLDATVDDDFTAQLSADMEKLLLEISAAHPEVNSASEQERQRAWEKMLIDGMNGSDGSEQEAAAAASSSVGGSTSATDPGAPGNEDAFQKSIRQAMEKLKQSDSSLQSDASSSAGAAEDPLEALLSQLGSNPDGLEESDTALQGMLEEMMGQLMSKEVLYEPLKELNDKFPSYISEHSSTLSAEDKQRFGNQAACVSKVIALFEDPSYKDGNSEKGAQIAELMNEMQSYGSPPAEIMGPLPPGFDFGANGMPNLPDGCTIS